MTLPCPLTGQNGCKRVIQDDGRGPKAIARNRRNDLIMHLWGSHNMDIIEATKAADAALERERERERVQGGGVKEPNDGN